MYAVTETETMPACMSAVNLMIIDLSRNKSDETQQPKVLSDIIEILLKQEVHIL